MRDGATVGGSAPANPATAAGPDGTGPDRVRRRRRVAPTVVLLGVVSMLTDISSESVTAILPLYVTVVLGLSPLAYGVVDSVYLGASAAVRLAAGWVSDRVDRPKWVAFTGYALSAVTRAALLLVTGLGSLVAVITADRIGKGIRTGPRDALITATSDPDDLGRSFGVHRALDTVGAMLGPLLAFAVLAAIPLGFDVVFVLSFAIALVGVAILGLLVPDTRRRAARPGVASPGGTAAHAAGTATAGTAAEVPERPRLRDLLRPRFVRLLIAAGLLGVATMSDGFIYLVLQRRDGLDPAWFPLLFVGTSLVYLVMAVPVGRLADRIGRTRVFLGGHVVLLAAYACAAGPVGGTATAVATLALLGLYYASTDGVVAAIAGALAPPAGRATGIAAVQTVVVAGRAVSSLLFGLLWTVAGLEVAVAVVTASLVVAIGVAAVLLRGVRRSTP